MKVTAKLIETIWNACIDHHNNRGENDIQYPDLEELKDEIL